MSQARTWRGGEMGKVLCAAVFSLVLPGTSGCDGGRQSVPVLRLDAQANGNLSADAGSATQGDSGSEADGAAPSQADSGLGGADAAEPLDSGVPATCTAACAHVYVTCGLQFFDQAGQPMTEAQCIASCAAGGLSGYEQCLSTAACTIGAINRCLGVGPSMADCDAMCGHVYNTCGVQFGGLMTTADCAQACFDGAFGDAVSCLSTADCPVPEINSCLGSCYVDCRDQWRACWSQWQRAYQVCIGRGGSPSECNRLLPQPDCDTPYNACAGNC